MSQSFSAPIGGPEEEGSENQKEESKKICIELIETYRNIQGVKGVHLMGHKKEEVISEIIKESKK